MSVDAIRAMSEQLAADPTSLVFLPLAEALLARGEVANAYRVARRGADRHVHRADVHDLVARVALAQGDEQTAERAWGESLAIARDFGPALRGLGFLCYQQQRWAEAESYLTAARAASPGDPAVEAAWAALQTARADAAMDAVAAVASTSYAPIATPVPSAPAVEAPVAVPAPTPVAAPVAKPPRTSASSRTPAASASLFDAALGDTAQVALLLDADGLVVAGRYETADGTDLGAVIGAHLSGVSDEAARAMRHFGLGKWTRILLESEAATLMMAPAGNGVTLVAAPRDVPLGFVRRTLDQSATVAAEWLAGGA